MILNRPSFNYEQGYINMDRKYLKKDKSGKIVTACKHYVSNYIPIFKCC